MRYACVSPECSRLPYARNPAVPATPGCRAFPVARRWIALATAECVAREPERLVERATVLTPAAAPCHRHLDARRLVGSHPGKTSRMGAQSEPVTGRYGAGRNETELERSDRNLVELMQEVRVVQTGVQVLFAFLLTAPLAPAPQTPSCSAAL